ncbi:tetraacyldisaccharide 4'-kinase [Aquabacterium sp.]|uniref:tetraacyldisaccharide 4'-kinase n=1 Tax=Aquabacterium sp. TaxID=1872578 RepID=UPI0035AF99C6
MSGVTDRLVSSWSRRGPLAWCLAPFSVLMWALVTLRRQAFRLGLLTSGHTGLPVVVVGNRIVGGAGKTPATIALIQHLRDLGWHPGVLTRGYRRDAASQSELTLLDQHTVSQLGVEQVGDEPMLIWRRTQAPMMIGRNRVQAGKALKESHPDIDILICDDGLQHLRLHRDIEVVVFDERGAGNGWLLPAGPLREPLSPAALDGLACDPIVLYNATKPSTGLTGYGSSRKLGSFIPLAEWWYPSHTSSGRSAAASPPHEEEVWAVAGIAHPPKFFNQLTQLGFRVHGVACPDHTDFADLPWPATVQHLIVTEKDAIKLQPARMAAERPMTQIWVATLDLEPDSRFWQALDSALARLPRRTHH